MQTAILGSSGIGRSLLFGLTGVLLFLSWLARPSYLMPASMSKWMVVLLFSAALLSLAVALPVFGRMVGGSQVVRWATIAGAVASLMSVANIFEDGFQIEWVFFAFVLGLLILDVALLALTIVTARTAVDRYRLLAVIPAGTVAGILLGELALGPIMLITWLVAAAVGLKMPSPLSPVPAGPTTT